MTTLSSFGGSEVISCACAADLVVLKGCSFVFISITSARIGNYVNMWHMWAGASLSMTRLVKKIETAALLKV